MIFDTLPPGKYKTITIRQPWATLIATGIKRYETRTTRSHYRGPILIHAGLTKMTESEDRLLDILITQFPTAGISRNPKDYPLGAIVCRCELTECIRATEPPTLMERMTGYWLPDYWALRLTNIEPLLIPNISGKQGFWYFEKPNNLVFEGVL